MKKAKELLKTLRHMSDISHVSEEEEFYQYLYNRAERANDAATKLERSIDQLERDIKHAEEIE